MHKIKKRMLHKKCCRCLQAFTVSALIALIGMFVYLTGGTTHSFANMMYIPIILASFYLGTKGGVLAAVLAGLVLGPLMPQVVSLGIMQPELSWMHRILFYVIISLFVSFLLNRINKLNKEIQDKAYENPGTGLPNINKFLIDLEDRMKENNSKSFTLLVFKFENLLQVSRYVDFFTGRKALKYLLDTAADYFPGKQIYSLYLDEFAVALPDADVPEACETGRLFLEKFENIHNVSSVPIRFFLKCGVINYPSHGENHRKFLSNLGKTMDHVETSGKNMAVFDGYQAEKNLKKYEILMEFLKYLNEDILTLHYQPKIDLKENRVAGVEALLRWKDEGNKHIRIDELIRIIEDAGVISRLTEWVVKKSMEQMEQWQKKGLDISVSVNLSSKDLSEISLLKYTKKYIERYKVDPSRFEFELTERTLIENKGKSVAYLNELKRIGVKISIDDYGTGYNSLMNMVNLPIDCIKIDKYFISNVCDSQGRKLVQDMISLIQNLDKKVLAEGVETAEQLEALREMGCDLVQGYYHSRPVPAEQISNAIIKINKSEAHSIA